MGNADLQYIDGHMWYAFSMHFDGSGNKHRLHGIEPGYILVSAEDPDAAVVEHYDGKFTMKICEDCGQESEPTRYAYTHGYSGYSLDDPTLEIDDQGNPYWTISLNTPHLGWTFSAPSALLVINAHTGQMTKYALNAAPEWVDRVYSQSAAQSIAGWYGFYQKGFTGTGSSNAGRYKVSGPATMVYTGDGHPDWRMLLTSYNSDSSVSKIIIMDSQTGAMRVYTPQQAMYVEDAVEQAFENGSGTGAGQIKSNHYQAVDLTLHVIYGHLTWMAIFEPEAVQGQNFKPSFIGLGFLDAYNVQGGNVVFGNDKSTALENYQSQLAAESSANGNAPEQGSQTQTVNGKIANIGWDISSGQKFWYLTLVGDPSHVYKGSSQIQGGVALVLAQAGDPVTLTFANVGDTESKRDMSSFTDTKVPLNTAGS